MFILSCKKNEIIQPKSPSELFEKYKNSVVLIYSQYYYEIDYKGSKLYYSPNSEEKIYINEEDVMKNLTESTGTGFIISDKGEIITNRHVVQPLDKNFRIELASFVKEVRNFISKEILTYTEKMNSLKNYYSENSYYMNYEEVQELQNLYTEYQTKYKELTFEELTFNEETINQSTAKPIIKKLAIAFNDTFVNELNDLQECVIVKVSDKDNIDLALIQTKTKTLNSVTSNYFNFIDNNPNLSSNPKITKARDVNKPVSINEDVYMIGFNKGFSLANTKLGIKAQFTSGKISQENDSERILYTIPTLEGSSGSPIIDKWGNLVAVNFAKISNTQNFSFGIPIKEVKNFVEN